MKELRVKYSLRKLIYLFIYLLQVNFLHLSFVTFSVRFRRLQCSVSVGACITYCNWLAY